MLAQKYEANGRVIARTTEGDHWGPGSKRQRSLFGEWGMTDCKKASKQTATSEAVDKDGAQPDMTPEAAHKLTRPVLWQLACLAQDRHDVAAASCVLAFGTRLG